MASGSTAVVELPGKRDDDAVHSVTLFDQYGLVASIPAQCLVAHIDVDFKCEASGRSSKFRWRPLACSGV